MTIKNNYHQTPATSHQSPIPSHVAIIMDGNGRWATARNLPRTAGHKKGADSLRTIMNACRDLGVTHLTVYAFSSENWRRSDAEISDLMQLLQHYLQQELQTLHENKIRLRFIGDTEMLSPEIQKQLAEAEQLTTRNNAFHFTIALSYGARQEITRAVQKLIAQGTAAADITEETISAALDTAGLPEPDLLIRTGGEERLSNFLLWQSAYTELYFTKTLWPDFGKKEFVAALENFAGRERRYGTAE
ncbi:MAG: polyprenyl diphosphate synthase [Alphaproteobacteria bacterium]|nr:polyprenyl diphosphate synthase [Alphaproteobacteria bacterium]